ncbi:MAG TPA: hypothetical protein PLS46_16435, partial [Microthrixaceae bacterium]|nr:hypothetical protein [Microthrixaceae bacterium]
MGSSPEAGPARLFDVGTPRAQSPSEPPSGRTVRVVCDVASIHREFDYVVPDRLLSRSGIAASPTHAAR